MQKRPSLTLRRRLLADGQKLITDLTLREEFSSSCNIPVEDTVQTWRVTGQQILEYVKDVLAPAGMVAQWAGATAPEGWMFCNGSVLQITSYQKLYNAIGTTWNNCRNHVTGLAWSDPETGFFRIPDLRGSFTRMPGTSSGYRTVTLGQTLDDATAPNGMSGNENKYPNANHKHDFKHAHQWAYSQGNFPQLNMHTLRDSEFNVGRGSFDNTIVVGDGGAYLQQVSTFALDVGGVRAYGPRYQESKRYYTSGPLSGVTTSMELTAAVSTADPSHLSEITSQDIETSPVCVGVNIIIKV